MNRNKKIKLALYSYRRLICRIRGSRIPFSTEVSERAYIFNTDVGKYCFISPNCSIYDATIGNYVSLGGNVQIGAMEHPVYDLSTNTFLCAEYPEAKKKTVIGHDVWIAGQSIIRQGVRIGNGAVIGANSFVNKDIPPYAVAVGSPAKVIKFRFTEELQAEIEKSRYWELSPKKAREVLESIRNRNNYGCKD